jgi:hypothetical protein
MMKTVRGVEYDTEKARELASVACHYETTKEVALKSTLYEQAIEEGSKEKRYFIATSGSATKPKILILDALDARMWVKVHARERYRQIFGSEEAQELSQLVTDSLYQLQEIESDHFVLSLLTLKVIHMIPESLRSEEEALSFVLEMFKSMFEGIKKQKEIADPE